MWVGGCWPVRAPIRDGDQRLPRAVAWKRRRLEEGKPNETDELDEGWS